MAPEPKTQQLVVFRLGAEEYALRIEDVHEVIRYTPPRRVTSSDDAVRGVISLRGRIISIFDLSSRLGVAAAADLDNARILVVEDHGEMTGLMVDAVTEVLTVSTEHFADAPVAGSECIAGIVRIDDRLLVLLDPKAATRTLSEQASDDTQAVA
jgi:purine-binding chemotaxis protein CheW